MGLAGDLSTEVSSILSSTWNFREGRVVPSVDDVALTGGGVELEATVLYADLAESSRLATEFQRRTAAKAVKCFLRCATRIIATQDGMVTSFDGDRVMGIFVGDSKNSNAARSALKIKYAVTKIIAPKLGTHFTSFREEGFDIGHAVGIDTGTILAVRAGQQGSNDLIWIGEAPNLAARLSEIREDGYDSYISNEVFNRLSDDAKNGGDPRRCMWEQRSFKWLGNDITIYRSNWHWEP